VPITRFTVNTNWTSAHSTCSSFRIHFYDNTTFRLKTCNTTFKNVLFLRYKSFINYSKVTAALNQGPWRFM